MFEENIDDSSRTKLEVLDTGQKRYANKDPKRNKFRILYAKQYIDLKKCTPPLVVTVVTHISYGHLIPFKDEGVEGKLFPQTPEP